MDVLLTVVVGSVLFWLMCLRRYGNGPRKYAVKKDREFNSDYKMTKVIKVPITRGMLTTFLSKLTSSFVGRLFLLDQMLNQGEFTMFRTIDMNINPTFYPNIELQEPCAKPNDINLTNDEIEEVLNGSKEKDGFTFNSVNDFVSKYRSGETTPSDVAENAIAAIENSKKLNAIVKYKLDSIRSQASASTERYRTSSTLSPLDGVFVVIKDEFAVKGMPYTNGTSYRNPGLLAKEDSVAVDKLRRLGCIVLAVANMHEFGFGTSGNNPNEGFGACRTPYDPNHYSGGSSSGCASAVAAGIATMGIGTDGGGSVRIPSSYCGIVGLKPTFARITLTRVEGLTNSVGHAGPLCVSVRDAALFYALLSGPDPGYPLGLKQPKAKIPKFGGNLNGIKIGVDRRNFKDCLSDVHEICCDALTLLESCGAQVESTEFAELHDILVAHRITIISEMSTNIGSDFDNYYNDISVPSRTLFKLGRSITAMDFIQANKQRTRAIEITRQFFEQYDALITPTCAQTAPQIHLGDLAVGSTNVNQDSLNMRYIALGNFTGIPGITIPVGYNAKGLPVGLQIMCAWWREDMALKIAECLERKVALRKPKIYNDIL